MSLNNLVKTVLVVAIVSSLVWPWGSEGIWRDHEGNVVEAPYPYDEAEGRFPVIYKNDSNYSCEGCEFKERPPTQGEAFIMTYTPELGVETYVCGSIIALSGDGSLFNMSGCSFWNGTQWMEANP